MMGESKAQILSQLRGLVAPCEPSLAGNAASRTPWTRMAPGGLHEIAPQDWRDGPAALGVVLGLAASRAGPCVWIDHPALRRDFGLPYGPGLQGFGFDPGRLIHVMARTDTDLLWAMEEAARLKGLGAVIGCLPAASKACTLTATRRLALAAAGTGALVLMVRDAGPKGLSAAQTRWSVAARPAPLPSQLSTQPQSLLDSSSPLKNIIGTLERPAPPRWQLTLEKCRAGKPGSWLIEWHDAALCFHLFAPSGDGPDQTDRPVPAALAG